MQSAEQRFQPIRKIGGHTRLSQDFYHYSLLLTWPKFFLGFLSFFVFFNLAFAVIYWLLPGSLIGTDGSLFQSFLFSVETYTTVGYGNFSPVTTVAHVIMVVQSVLSIFSSAVLTGLVFAKFSKPNARILFSSNVLINNFDGRRSLMFRMGNLRNNQIAEAQVHVVLLQTHVTKEGERIRRQIDLPLQRNNSLFFALSWLVIHEIDEKSPLYGLQAKDLVEKNIEIAVSVIGNDSTFAQTVHSSCIYSPEEVIYDRFFADVLELDGKTVKAINYKKFNDLKPV